VTTVIRTDNAVKSYHAALKRQMLVSHPNMFFSVFIDDDCIGLRSLGALFFVVFYNSYKVCPVFSCLTFSTSDILSVILVLHFPPSAFSLLFSCPVFSVNTQKVRTNALCASNQINYNILMLHEIERRTL